MHALVVDEVAHRVIAGHGQAVLLAIEAIDKVEEDLGLEIGQLQLVNVVPEQVAPATVLMVGAGLLVRGLQ